MSESIVSTAMMTMDEKPGEQTTFALVKSHAVAVGRHASVIEQILGFGITILAMRSTVLSYTEMHALYAEHVEQPYWPDLQASVSGPVVLMALRGMSVIAAWRSMLGEANSMLAAPGTIRAEWGSRKTLANNVAHGSDSIEAAQRELSLFFPALIRVRPETPVTRRVPIPISVHTPLELDVPAFLRRPNNGDPSRGE